MSNDFIIIGLYLALMFIAGVFFSRNIKNTADYFLAARSAPWFWIMGAVWATNIFSRPSVSRILKFSRRIT